MNAIAPAPTETPEEALQAATERGLLLYDTQPKDTLGREHLGETVVIHPDTRDYFVSDNPQAAMREMKARHPHGLMVVTRIGPVAR